MMNTTAGSTMTPAQLRACLPPEQAPGIIAILDAESIAEHGADDLLRAAIERIATDPISRATLLGVGWMYRPKKALHILKNNREFWCLPQAIQIPERAIRTVREVLNANELGRPPKI